MSSPRSAHTFEDRVKKCIFLAFCTHYIVTTLQHTVEVKAGGLLCNYRPQTPLQTERTLQLLNKQDELSLSVRFLPDFLDPWIFLKRQIMQLETQKLLLTSKILPTNIEKVVFSNIYALQSEILRRITAEMDSFSVVWRMCSSLNSQRSKYKVFQRKQLLQHKTIRLYPQQHSIKCQVSYRSKVCYKTK